MNECSWRFAGRHVARILAVTIFSGRAGWLCFFFFVSFCYASALQMRYKFLDLHKKKIRKPFVYWGFRIFERGAWRTRTAVDGFADR